MSGVLSIWKARPMAIMEASTASTAARRATASSRTDMVLSIRFCSWEAVSSAMESWALRPAMVVSASASGLRRRSRSWRIS